jgi:hypothetical protein
MALRYVAGYFVRKLFILAKKTTTLLLSKQLQALWLWRQAEWKLACNVNQSEIRGWVQGSDEKVRSGLLRSRSGPGLVADSSRFCGHR